MNEKPAIIDARRIINHRQAEKLGFTYYGIGFRINHTKPKRRLNEKP